MEPAVSRIKLKFTVFHFSLRPQNRSPPATQASPDKLPLWFVFPYLVRKFNSVLHHGVRRENADFNLT